MELTEKKNPILVGIYGNTADVIIEQIENLGKKYDEISFMITPPFSEKISSDAVESYFENICRLPYPYTLLQEISSLPPFNSAPFLV